MREILFFSIALLSATIEGELNIAFGKIASASSNMADSGPDKAVDGDRSTTTSTVFHSQDGLESSWWSLDLVQEVNFPKVSIYFRTGYIVRRNGVRISLYPVGGGSNDFCHVVSGAADGSNIPDIYNFTCATRGRYLNISTVTDNDSYGAILDFGEVEVYVRKAAEVNIYTKYISQCDVLVIYILEPVVLAQILELEQTVVDYRIECMWKCDALDLCILFEYSSPTCTFWREGSSGLSGSREMWKKQY